MLAEALCFAISLFTSLSQPDGVAAPALIINKTRNAEKVGYGTPGPLQP